MKTKRIIGIAVMMVLLGGVMAFAGAVTGGSSELQWNGNRRRFERFDRGQVIAIDQTLPAFSSIQADGGNFDLTVIKGNAFGISGNTSEAVVIDVVGDTLVITSNEMGANDIGFGVGRRHGNITRINFGLFGHMGIGSSERETLTVTVPTPEVLLNLNLGTNRLNIHDLTLLSGSTLRTSTGNMNLKADLRGTTTVQSSTGNITIEGNIDGTSSITGSTGNIQLDGAVAGTLNLRTSTGNIRANIDGARSDFAYDLHTNTGRLTIDGERHQNERGSGGSVQKDNGTNRIEVRNSTGNIALSFN